MKGLTAKEEGNHGIFLGERSVVCEGDASFL